MYKISNRDFNYILNMLESISKIQQYSSKFKTVDEFYEDTIAFDATLMNFIVIGEMVEKLSEKFLNESKKEIEWSKVRGFRNIIAHNYFGVDAEEVWQIINGSLIKLKENLQNFSN
ncbi:HepT-like ribonuclease domain-containing protein [Aureibaculum sp. 2210JD6-5]|uniref:HepT-like ribonuclease domain-containing protein n=1 Tax=Aureibaculum sp. 2210JD6-5 TaxID=3103957 RepID=UPI002AACB25F|nr:HepT-like ribonuclease domain-containing protein [Aureibaculum sp. 2210JD6-5]MDY7395636.1 HepT-like ribonuclease domain-containing protein [Aureibaculum sp. 2210JD6-5]